MTDLARASIKTLFLAESIPSMPTDFPPARTQGQTFPRPPLIVTKALLEKAATHEDTAQRLQGWKWHVLFTPDAALWLKDNQLI